jgi:hypothetical protein
LGPSSLARRAGADWTGLLLAGWATLTAWIGRCGAGLAGAGSLLLLNVDEGPLVVVAASVIEAN